MLGAAADASTAVRDADCKAVRLLTAAGAACFPAEHVHRKDFLCHVCLRAIMLASSEFVFISRASCARMKIPMKGCKYEAGGKRNHDVDVPAPRGTDDQQSAFCVSCSSFATGPATQAVLVTFQQGRCPPEPCARGQPMLLNSNSGRDARTPASGLHYLKYVAERGVPSVTPVVGQGACWAGALLAILVVQP